MSSIKYQLLEQIENIKQQIKDQDYKDIIENVAKIPNKHSNKNKYLMEVLIISPTINDEDQSIIRGDVDVERVSFDIYLTQETRDIIALKTAVDFDEFDTLHDNLEICEKLSLENISKALRIQRIQINKINKQVIFLETRYLFGNISS